MKIDIESEITKPFNYFWHNDIYILSLLIFFYYDIRLTISENLEFYSYLNNILSSSYGLKFSLKNYTDSCLSSDCIGKDTIMYGSKVIDIFLQSGQVNLDLNWPYIKSIITD